MDAAAGTGKRRQQRAAAAGDQERRRRRRRLPLAPRPEMLVLLLPGSPACGPARRRRQELVLGQLCLLGSLLLLLSSLSCWAGSAGPLEMAQRSVSSGTPETSPELFPKRVP